MTKMVRVENADTSNFGVAVEIWDKGVDGAADTLARTIELRCPAAMTDAGCYITSTRYLVVKEMPSA